MSKEVIHYQRTVGDFIPVCGIQFMQILTKWQRSHVVWVKHYRIALKSYQGETIFNDGAIVRCWGGKTATHCYGHGSAQLAQPMKMLLNRGSE
jgi:hypothetical protein